jgi:GT2 family glycosyltransferase
MKSCFLTVFYNTPDSEKKRIESQVKKRGIDCFDAVDHTISKSGYAEGINTLLKKHEGDFDIYFIGNPDIDISGLKNIYAPAEQFDIFGFTMVQDENVYYGGELDPKRLSGGLQLSKPDRRFISVDFVSGSFMGIKKEVIEKIGYLDEGFGMYYEDVEYSQRALQAGLSVGIDSSQSYIHFEESKKNPRKDALLAKSRWRFFWKYARPHQKIYEILRLPKTLLEDGRHLL